MSACVDHDARAEDVLSMLKIGDRCKRKVWSFVTEHNPFKDIWLPEGTEFIYRGESSVESDVIDTRRCVIELLNPTRQFKVTRRWFSSVEKA